ncbi:MAG: PLP-dependent aminotransferase family protein [Microlunatus sp.]|nr:PLP-dependent aminotransferase family protein [Microlunatus sp.]
MNKPVEEFISQRMAAQRPPTSRRYGPWLRGPHIISFAGGLPDPAFFDHRGLREAYDHVLDTDPGRALQYANGEGEPDLREQAARLLTDEGFPTEPADLMITTGSQQGISLIGTVLIDPGDVILVESPTYMSAVRAFGLSGAKMISVETDLDGIVPEDLQAKINQHAPKLVYLIPTFQNPTGITIPPERRSAIADVISRNDILLVEDDPYSELRFHGEQQPPIAADHRLDGKTILLSTLSKVLAPGLRIGWLRAPAALKPLFVSAKQAMDMHTSVIDQMASAYYADRFMRDPHRLDPVRAAYRERCATMGDWIDKLFPAGTRRTHPDGGMFIWVSLPDDHNTDVLLPHAIDAGVTFLPGSSFYADNPVRSNFRLSFCTHDTDKIEEGIKRLAGAIEESSAPSR